MSCILGAQHTKHIMAFVFLLTLFSLFAFLVSLYNASCSDALELTKAEGDSVPTPWFHSLNKDLCIGCEACIDVCPTNVLDLINHKVAISRFQDCVQCQQCTWSCPTSALVMFPEGGKAPDILVPDLDNHYQSKTPGQYLIGAVAGKPLVKNGANIGRIVVEHMRSVGLAPTNHGDDSYDIVIIGSGPAGLSAGLSAQKVGLKVIVLEKEDMFASTIARYPKGKVFMAEPRDVENLSFLQVESGNAKTLHDGWSRQISTANLQIRTREPVVSVQCKQENNFIVETPSCRYRARRVVVATGLQGTPRQLDAAGSDNPKVMSRLDDPSLYSGMHVVVVGGGDSALEAAMALAQHNARVTLCYRGKKLLRANVRNRKNLQCMVDENRLRLVLQCTPLAILDSEVELGFPEGRRERIANDLVFSLIGSIQPSAWLSALNIEYVSRPHEYQKEKTDTLLRTLLSLTCKPVHTGAPRFARMSEPSFATGKERYPPFAAPRRKASKPPPLPKQRYPRPHPSKPSPLHISSLPHS